MAGGDAQLSPAMTFDRLGRVRTSVKYPLVARRNTGEYRLRANCLYAGSRSLIMLCPLSSQTLNARIIAAPRSKSVIQRFRFDARVHRGVKSSFARAAVLRAPGEICLHVAQIKYPQTALRVFVKPVGVIAVNHNV